MPIHWEHARVRVGGLGRVRCEPGWHLDQSWSDWLSDFDLWFVWAGHGWMNLDGSTVELRPGICFWVRPGHSYLATQDEQDRLGVTFIHFDLLDQNQHLHQAIATRRNLPASNLLGELPPIVHDLPDVHYVDAVMRRVVELLRLSPARSGLTAPSEHATLTATALFTGLLIDIDSQLAQPATHVAGSTAERHHQKIISEIVSEIYEDPREVPPIAELARRSHYSADHFAKVFRQVTGQTPQEMIVQARIDRARQLLRESALSITQVAQALGYDNVYFFSRQFKHKTSQTPTQYRQSASTMLNS